VTGKKTLYAIPACNVEERRFTTQEKTVLSKEGNRKGYVPKRGEKVEPRAGEELTLMIFNMTKGSVTKSLLTKKNRVTITAVKKGERLGVGS